MVKLLSAVFLLVQTAAAQGGQNALLFSRTLGDDAETIRGVSVDPYGNVVVAGHTAATDFPSTNGSRNAGSSISVSEDYGRTWTPLTNPPQQNGSLPIAVDASTPPVLYTGDRGIYRSTDGGSTWKRAAGFPNVDCTCDTTALVAHPTRPGVVYAGGPLGIYKTLDGGQSWVHLTDLNGEQNHVDYLVMDPANPDTLYASSFTRLYRSGDGGATWQAYSLPGNPVLAFPSIPGVAFDAAPGTVYQIAGGLFRSTDNGLTWSKLDTPFDRADGLAADPLAAGFVYVEAANGIYRSTDRGATWQPAAMVRQANDAPVVNPGVPSVLLPNGTHSEDQGVTWTRTLLGVRPQQLTYDPMVPGRVWAGTHPSWDVFLTRLDPSGREILSSRYFGGPGDETSIAVALDAQNNAYVLGSTVGPGILSTPGVAVPVPEAANAFFLAKFDPDGRLLFATYVNGDPADVAASPDGSAVVLDYGCRVMRFSSDGATAAAYEALVGQGYFCDSLDVNRAGGIAVGGYATGDSTPPTTPDAFQHERKGDADGVFALLSPAGDLIYASLLNGDRNPVEYFPPNFVAATTHVERLQFDGDGNIVLVGITGSVHFPTTPGAFQGDLNAQCAGAVRSAKVRTLPYPLSVSIVDIFVTRFDPTGTKLLSSTLLGGPCEDRLADMAVDGDGNVWVTGVTSGDFPMKQAFSADGLSFLAKISADATELLLSSLVAPGRTRAVAAGPEGDAWIGSDTNLQGAYLARVGESAVAPLDVISVGNLFSRRAGPAVPGAWTLVRVYGLDPGGSVSLTWTPAEPLPRQLLDVEVLFDGEPAAIDAVGPGYIECVTPYSVVGKTSVIVQVRHGGQVSQELMVPVALSSVGLLSAEGSGTGRAEARNQDGSLNSATNPAAPGSFVRFYFTGANLGGLGCPYGGLESVSTQGPMVRSSYGELPSYALPGFLCGIYEVRFPVPATWDTRLDATFNLEDSPFLIFSVQR